jgi:hypothetical protein
MISADDVVATLRFLVPGFVALRVFSTLALKTKRTDLELTLWSLLAAAVIDALASLVNPGVGLVRLVLALGIAVALGAFGSAAWLEASRRWPTLLEEASPSAWEGVLGTPHWVQVSTTSGEVIFGYVRILGLAAETDDPDLYLEEPGVVNATTGARTPIEGTEGLIIKRSDIRLIQVLAPVPPATG